MITDHSRFCYDIGEDGQSISALVVQCDFCYKFAWKTGRNAGSAAEAARKEGFQTVKGKNLGDPLRWACPNCVEKGEGQ